MSVIQIRRPLSGEDSAAPARTVDPADLPSGTASLLGQAGNAQT
jgi:hypothetical protein